MKKASLIVTALLISTAICITCGCSQNSMQKESNKKKNPYHDCGAYTPASSLSADRLGELQKLPKNKLPGKGKPAQGYTWPITTDKVESSSTSSDGTEKDRDLGEGAEGEKLKQVK